MIYWEDANSFMDGTDPLKRMDNKEVILIKMACLNGKAIFYEYFFLM